MQCDVHVSQPQDASLALLHDLHLQEGQGTNIGYASKNYMVWHDFHSA